MSRSVKSRAVFHRQEKTWYRKARTRAWRKRVHETLKAVSRWVEFDGWPEPRKDRGWRTW